MKKISWFACSTILVYLIFQGAYALSHGSASISLSDLKSGKRTLIVGHIADFPPFYTSNDSNPQGLDPDIFKEVAKRAGIKKIIFKSFRHFTALNEALHSGGIDIIVSDYWDIPDHSSQFLMTHSYYLRDGVAFVYDNKKYRFNSPQDLRGQKIGAFVGATDVNHWLKKANISGAIIQMFASRKELMQALKEEKIAAAFVYYTLYLYLYGQHHAEYPFAVVLVKPIDSVYAVRHQDTALHQKLNEAIESMWKDNSLYKIKKKHLGPLGIEPAHVH